MTQCKEPTSAEATGDAGLMSGSGRSPEKNLPTHSKFCLGNPIGRGAWQVTVYGVAKESDMTELLTLSLYIYIYEREREIE